MKERFDRGRFKPVFRVRIPVVNNLRFAIDDKVLVR